MVHAWSFCKAGALLRGLHTNACVACLDFACQSNTYRPQAASNACCQCHAIQHLAATRANSSLLGSLWVEGHPGHHHHFEGPMCSLNFIAIVKSNDLRAF
eukprot:scaffold32669_cov24-Tisochrysis_lutea.AAC.2